MADIVLVFTFPEPSSSVALGMLIARAKEVFEDMPNVQIHMGRNDPAKKIMEIVTGTRINGG